MLAAGDSVARNAFRVGLRQDTPLPIAVGVTQELDPSDILEVRDMAEAIARAEKLVAAPRSSARGLDIFEALGRPTDDTAGPATAAPPRQTPLPPPPSTPPPSVPAPRFITMPPSVTNSVGEDDAYFQPAGRMRSLADATLEGYRPEPTLLVRAASRRKRVSWVLVAALLPLMIVLAAVALFADVDTASAAGEMTRRAPAVAAREKTPLSTTSASTKSSHAVPTPPTSQGSKAAPVFDVNSLPSAGAIRTKR